ncbi:hypothetical protein [Actinophytocola sp.]|uniref:hypothetical protein n=1 Tax=Actinophytocola sp. TaxID=1872138 RepID=UPI002ED1D5B4
MVGSSVKFTAGLAPCGKRVDGERYQEDDDEGLSFDDLTYACGCRRIRHVYHDGSIRIRTVRHDGKVLLEEHNAEHEA